MRAFIERAGGTPLVEGTIATFLAAWPDLTALVLLELLPGPLR